ncbi:MAG: hypothetical protein V1720_05745 [bacterium]
MKSKKTITLFFGVLLYCPVLLLGQSSSNFDEIIRLIDVSVDKISGQAEIKGQPISLKITTPGDYGILKSKIISAFSGKNFKINTTENATENSIEYTLEEVKVSYIDMFREGFLGSFQVERETRITGSFIIISSNIVEKTDNFNLSAKDTVYVDEISDLENPALPFTHSDLPEEPFMSGLLEPVVAVGSAVVAIVLFFTVRSK